MKSRNQRLRRTILTLNMVPLLVRLGVLVLFGILIFVQNKVYIEGISEGPMMTAQPDGSFDIRMPLSDFLQGRLVVMLGLALLTLVSLTNGISSIFAEHRRRAEVPIETVQSYLETNRFRRQRTILMLRPFETDGFLFLPEKRGFWRNALVPAIQTATVEQIVKREAEAYGDVDVISVADPYKDELVPGPTYLMTGSDWKSDVQQLIATADGIAFVIPVIGELTPGLCWEIEQTFLATNAKNAAAIFPPEARKTAEMQAIIAHFLASSSAEFKQDLPWQSIFMLDLKPDGTAWYEVRKSWRPWPQRAHSDIYGEAARNWLKGVLSKPKDQRPHGQSGTVKIWPG